MGITVTNYNNGSLRKGRFLIDQIDLNNMNYLAQYDQVSFYNIESGDLADEADYKKDDNITYLNKAFKVVRKLKSLGYNGRVVIECDSLYDISQSNFNYQSFDACFTTSLYSIDAINDLVNFYLYNTGNDSLDNMSTKDIILKILFFQVKELISYIEESKDFRDEIKNSLSNYIYNIFPYDLGKIIGINFVKYSDSNLTYYYYFEKGDKKVKKINPEELLDGIMYYLNEKGGFLEYGGVDDEELFNAIEEGYDSAIKNNDFSIYDKDTIFDDYLNCNSLDELNSVLKRICNQGGNMSRQYIYLLNILNDLDFDSYKEHMSLNFDLSDDNKLRIAINDVFNRMLVKKEELTRRKITMISHS